MLTMRVLSYSPPPSPPPPTPTSHANVFISLCFHFVKQKPEKNSENDYVNVKMSIFDQA